MKIVPLSVYFLATIFLTTIGALGQEKPTPAPAGESKDYVIKSGDNPWLIAKNHGVSLAELLKVNKIKDPKNLKIGQVIILPAGAKATKAAPSAETTKPEPADVATEPAEPAAGDNWELYTIKRGDNPWNIAKRLKVKHQQIVELNSGLNFRDLKIGQKIKVPKKPKN
jgi:LysM repeat protein